MNIIEKLRLKKEEKKPINIVLNSDFNYEDHDINILKACLNVWSKDQGYTNIKYDWIYTNPEQNTKMYFVSTTIGELRKMNLEHIANNPDVIANSYMNSYFSCALFYPNDLTRRVA